MPNIMILLRLYIFFQLFNSINGYGIFLSGGLMKVQSIRMMKYHFVTTSVKGGLSGFISLYYAEAK